MLLTIIGFDNGLALVNHQAIIWNSAGLSSIGPLWNLNTFFFSKQENEIIDIVCKISTILFQSQIINESQDRYSGVLYMNGILLLYNSCYIICLIFFSCDISVKNILSSWGKIKSEISIHFTTI